MFSKIGEELTASAFQSRDVFLDRRHPQEVYFLSVLVDIGGKGDVVFLQPLCDIGKYRSLLKGLVINYILLVHFGQ